jgi:hypothetical protein
MSTREAAKPNESTEKKQVAAQQGVVDTPGFETELYAEKILPREKAIPRGLTPRNVIHLQRTIGNRSFNQLHQNAFPAPVIQRGVEAGAGAEMTAQSMKVSLDFTPSKEVKSTYAVVTFSTPVNVEGELKSKDESPANVGMDTGGTAKASVNIYDQKDAAVRAGKDRLAQMAYDSIDTSGFEVDKVDWEGELGKSEGEVGDKVGIAMV